MSPLLWTQGVGQSSHFLTQSSLTAHGQLSKSPSEQLMTASASDFRVYLNMSPNLLLRLLLSKEKLRLLLIERNLPAYGNKADLLKRLREFGQNPDQWDRQVGLP